MKISSGVALFLAFCVTKDASQTIYTSQESTPPASKNDEIRFGALCPAALAFRLMPKTHRPLLGKVSRDYASEGAILYRTHLALDGVSESALVASSSIRQSLTTFLDGTLPYEERHAAYLISRKQFKTLEPGLRDQYFVERTLRDAWIAAEQRSTDIPLTNVSPEELQAFFSLDPKHPGQWAFRPDFEERVANLRSIQQKRRWLWLYRASHFEAHRLPWLLDNCLQTKRGEPFYRSLVEILDQPSANAALRARLLLILAHYWSPVDDDAEPFARRLIAALDFALKENSPEAQEDLNWATRTLAEAYLPTEAMHDLLGLLTDPKTLQALTEPAIENGQTLDRMIDGRLHSPDTAAGASVLTGQWPKLAASIEKSVEPLRWRLESLLALGLQAIGRGDNEGKTVARKIAVFTTDFLEASSPTLGIQASAVHLLTELAYQYQPEALHWMAAQLGMSLADDAIHFRTVRSVTIIESISEPDLRKGLFLVRLLERNPSALQQIAESETALPALRLAALSLYVRDRPLESTWVLGVWKTHAALAETLIREKVASPSAWTLQLFRDPLLQNEEARVYTFATLLVLQKRLGMVSMRAAFATNKQLWQGRLQPYRRGADAGFNIGGSLFLDSQQLGISYFLVLAHETMHNFLKAETGLDSDNFSAGLLHELAADLAVDVFAKVFSISSDEFKADSLYDAHWERTLADGFQTTESHEGARSQLKILYDTWLDHGLTFDPLRALRTLVHGVKRRKGARLYFKEWLQAILQDYQWPDDWPSANDRGVQAYSADPADPFYLNDYHLRQPLMRPRELIPQLRRELHPPLSEKLTSVRRAA